MGTLPFCSLIFIILPVLFSHSSLPSAFPIFSFPCSDPHMSSNLSPSFFPSFFVSFFLFLIHVLTCTILFYFISSSSFSPSFLVFLFLPLYFLCSDAHICSYSVLILLPFFIFISSASFRFIFHVLTSVFIPASSPSSLVRFLFILLLSYISWSPQL